MSVKPSLRMNAVSNWCVLVVSVSIGFLLTPYLTRHLGKSGYGIWTLANSYVGYYGLLNLGIRSAITRYIALYSAQNDTRRLNQVASTTLAIFAATATVTLVASFALATNIAGYFNIPLTLRNDFTETIKILGLATSLSFIYNVFGAVVAAREHYIAINISTIIFTIIRALIVVVLIKNGFGLLGVAYSTLTVSILQIATKFLLFRHFASDVTFGFAYIKKSTFKVLVCYGGITSVITLADFLRHNLDSFVIGRFVNMDAVGVYGISALVIRYMLNTISAGISVLSPRFSRLDGSGQKQEIRRIFIRALEIASAISFAMTFFAVAFGPKFIQLWAGEEFAEAGLVLIIISTAYAFDLSQCPSISLMYAMNKHKYYAFYTICEALANAILSIILVQKYGMIGVAIGTAVPMIVIKCFVMPFYVSTIFNIKPKEYLSPFRIPFAITSIFLAFFYIAGFNHSISECNLFYLTAYAAPFGFAYFIIIGAYSLPERKKTRMNIRNILKSFFPREIN